MKALLFFLSLVAFLSASAREKKLVHHPNGKVQYEYEMDGFMFDGRFSCYYESGKLKVKGQFSRNKKTGLWRVWDEKGILRSERMYTGNLEFSILNETDSTGNRIRSGEQVNAGSKSSGITLFMHRFLHSINRDADGAGELFGDNGLFSSILAKVRAGMIPVFTDERLTTPVNIPSMSCIEPGDLVEILVKEEYSCFEDEGPVMVNRLVSICPVVMEKGKPKELGWIQVADLEKTENFLPVLNKIRDRQYASRILKTTVNDPSFKWRTVALQEHDLLRLMMVEYEAGAIIYVMDQQTLASS